MITTTNGAAARPLGLAAYPGQSERCVEAAFSGGVNFFFFYGPSHTSVIHGLRPVIQHARDDVIIAGGSGSRRAGGLERVRRTFERELGATGLDLFFAEYLNPSDDLSVVFGKGGPIETLCRWRNDGVVRHVGASTHDASLAVRCIEDGRIEVLMLRCNMAHRRVCSAVFPRAQRAGVSVVAFTATRWGTLLEGHPDWSEVPPTALDCYRYCLSQSAVEVVLSAATTVAQLRVNLPLLTAPPLEDDDRRRWETYGDLVHGTGTGTFETAWP